MMTKCPDMALKKERRNKAGVVTCSDLHLQRVSTTQRSTFRASLDIRLLPVTWTLWPPTQSLTVPLQHCCRLLFLRPAQTRQRLFLKTHGPGPAWLFCSFLLVLRMQHSSTKQHSAPPNRKWHTEKRSLTNLAGGPAKEEQPKGTKAQNMPATRGIRVCGNDEDSLDSFPPNSSASVYASF